MQFHFITEGYQNTRCILLLSITSYHESMNNFSRAFLASHFHDQPTTSYQGASKTFGKEDTQNPKSYPPIYHF